MPDSQVSKPTIRRPLGFIAVYFGALLGLAAAQPLADREAIVAALSKRDFASALQLLDAALKKSPHDAELLTMQGVTYERQGAGQPALASFRKALQVSPDYILALEGAI